MKVQRDGRSFTVDVTADGEGVVSHAGAALIAAAADEIVRVITQTSPDPITGIPQV